MEAIQILLIVVLLTFAFVASQLAVILFLAKENEELKKQLGKVRPPF
jgi:hypothetical protein